MHKYLLQQLESDELAVFTVWGPMLGEEVRADADAATVALPDPRVEHFWTGEHTLAEALAGPLGLAPGELAWDVYLVYAPGTRWGDEPPVPDTVMHVDKSLPDEQRLNGEKLFDRAAELIAGDAATR